MVSERGSEYSALQEQKIKSEITHDKWRTDPVVKFVRFTPDLLVLNWNKVIGYFAEKKTTNGVNYDVELDAYETYKLFDSIFPNKVFIILARPRPEPIKACWVKDIDFFRIIIPKSRYTEEEWKSIKNRYSCIVSYQPVSDSGSGTSFGLIRRDAPYLRDLDDFISEELV